MTEGDQPTHDANSMVRAELVNNEGRVTLIGEIDHGVAPELDEALKKLLSEGADRLVVDFARLSFFDSACISALVRAYSAMSERGGTVTLVNVDRFAYRVLEIAGLLPLFDIVPVPVHAGPDSDE